MSTGWERLQRNGIYLWFKAFGERDSHGRTDVMIIQETHVEASEADYFARLFASRWGFRTGVNQTVHSYWAPSRSRKGGVAILIDPYGSFKDTMPYLQEWWTPNFMAIKGTLDGEPTIVCNVYVPHKTRQRECFYESLTDIEFPKDAMLLVGGDFNCTLDDQADRSYHSATSSHGSPALSRLLCEWGVLDPIAVARPKAWTPEALTRHHLDTHTYHYTVPNQEEASSRLDRWYVSAPTMPWVASWNLVHSGTTADHQGAKIHLLRDFQDKLQAHEGTAEEAAEQWDMLKREVARRTRICIRERKRTRRNTLRQKLARLIRIQNRDHDLKAGQTPTVDTITDLFDGLTQDSTAGPSRSARLRRAIAECKRTRAGLRQRRLFQDTTYWTGKTTKSLFKRVSTKFADNTVHRLDPVPGATHRAVHAKADILADAWTPIMQQPAAASSDVDEVAAWVTRNEDMTPAQAAVADAITEADVRRAIHACKPGKAAGPDRLGNGWYRDYEEVLIPILTQLFNLWYDVGYFPSSFLEADIFCLKKGGPQSNALNYRSIALLNTDYKLFTRILASRVSATLPDLIHPNQNGFVPGRTIHETLDLFEAAQSMILADPSQREATALLLDFKKAYDSLDREFLITVLRKQKFPEKFVKAVENMHHGTTVEFLANGSKSRKVLVT